MTNLRNEFHVRNCTAVQVRQKKFRADNKLSGYEGLTGVLEADSKGMYYTDDQRYRIRFDIPFGSDKPRVPCVH